MNPQLVMKLVDVAISLAQTQLDGHGTTQALLSIVQQGVRAYENHTGGPIDPKLIRAEEPL